MRLPDPLLTLFPYTTLFRSVDGNRNGDVTVVEFFDYNCGYCKKAAPTLAALVQSDPKVRIVYKEDRKSTRLNSSHMSISYAVLCLKKKNKTSRSAVDD